MLVMKSSLISVIGFISVLISSVNLEVPLIMQYPNFPTGCESVATTALLQYYGYKIDENEFVDNYVDTIESNASNIGDFENVFDAYFVGNPRSSHGFLCNPPVMINSVKKYFSEINEVNRSPVDLTGTDFNILLDEIADGNPVVIWVTIDFKEPIRKNWHGSEYFTPSHTVVLSGYNRLNNTVTFTDSISGVVTVDYSKAKSIYEAVGKRCFILKES